MTFSFIHCNGKIKKIIFCFSNVLMLNPEIKKYWLLERFSILWKTSINILRNICRLCQFLTESLTGFLYFLFQFPSPYCYQNRALCQVSILFLCFGPHTFYILLWLQILLASWKFFNLIFLAADLPMVPFPISAPHPPALLLDWRGPFACTHWSPERHKQEFAA